jgi:hypothetical protein
MTMTEGESPPARAAVRAPGKRRRVYVRWSPAVADRLCERLAAGEVLYAICRDPAMPTAEGVAKWARARPGFAADLEAARQAGGRPSGTRGRVSTWCQEAGERVFQRLCEGESLTAIGRDPTMPSLSTLFYWRRRIPEFEDMVRLGKEIQAERFCDLGWEMAAQATPQTAYLTHVRLGQLRWMAGVMAPKVFRLKPVEPETPPATMNIAVRHFEVEVDEATGKRKVVAWCPNPETGEVEREDAPGWRPPAGATLLPGGWE